MDKTVYGVCESSSEVRKAISQLIAKGYSEDHITIITDQEERLDLEKYRDSEVKTISDTNENDTLINKIKHFFFKDETHDSYAQLINYGLSEGESSSYSTDIEKGKILVLLDLNASKRAYEVYSDDSESSSLKMVDRYDPGLSLVENPEPNLYVDEEIKVGNGDHTLADKNHKHSRKDKDDLQLNDSSFEEEATTEDDYLKNKLNTDHL